jgi:hypothetical protein
MTVTVAVVAPQTNPKAEGASAPFLFYASVGLRRLVCGRFGREPPSLATLLRFSHLCAMPTDFSVFRNRFAEACLFRGMKPEAVYRSVGIGGRRALDFESVGVLRALDLYGV